MEVMEDKGKEQAQDNSPRTHEQQLREFSADLNSILSKGYSLPAVLTVLETAIFEMRMTTYMMQIEAMERQRQSEKRIEIPNMKIPSNKK